MSEELNVSSQEPQEVPETSLGAILKAAREARGMSVADVATALHLRPSIVKDIEADDFSNIGSSTYVRGYVKNFARIVDADRQQVEACLARQVASVSQPAMQSFSRKTVRQARDSRYQMVTWLVLIVLIVLMIFWWLQTSKFFNSAGVDFSHPTAEEVEASSDTDMTSVPVSLPGVAEMEAPESVKADDNVEAKDNLQAESEATLETNLAPALQEPVQLPEAQPVQLPETETAVLPDTPASITQDTLALALSADCWIQVKDASGKVLFSELRKAGQSLNISGKAPFSLILGAPQAVTVTFNGETVGLNEFSNGKVARFTLPKNG
ncbi:RodZ domain-containing protein [Shewanella sp.]|uniref:RodZ domain-containing protein n=1 Tax=Shewanella sp. TaxID=50422 RepID=UPI003568C30D